MSVLYSIEEIKRPGLLILDPTVVENIVIPSLLEYCPTVIVTQQALPYFYNKNITINALCLFDIITEKVDSRLSYQKNYEVYFTESNSVIHDSRKFLEKQGVSGLDIIGRITPLLKEAINNDLRDIDTTVYFGNAKYHYVREGYFCKWTNPGHGFFTEADIMVKTYGLRNLDQNHFKSEKEGKIYVEANEAFWLGEIIL